MDIQIQGNTVHSSEAIREQVQRILSSRTLVQSKRLAQFLRFVVEKGIAGDSDNLNEYLIGTEVYERASSFDPQTDTIVRTEARRLRSKLRQYYDTEGVSDPILIEVPKGSYAPLFRKRDHAILEKTALLGRNRESVSPGDPRRRPFRLMGRSERTIILKAVSLLQDISAEDLSYVAGIAEETEAAPGSSIFREGDHGDCLFIILEGSVRIHRGPRELAVLGRLESFGEMAVLDGAPRSASATALQDTTMIKVDREQFLDLMRGSPEIVQRILRLLVARIRETNKKLTDV